MSGILERMRAFAAGRRELEPAKAYDRWAADYDDQPGNLMIDLDEQIFTALLAGTELTGKQVADIGCGTGRHWNKILEMMPKSLTGFDVSSGMLDQLQIKFPGAVCHVVKDHLLSQLPDNAADLLISTLTIAHIGNITGMFAEWNRVLKPGGEVLLTDYHPEALARGARRTFRTNGKHHSIVNHVYYLETVRSVAQSNGLQVVRLEERLIDQYVKHYYESQGALELYQRFQQVPIIYGMHLKKPDAAA
jgi:ubiquinone/menaquinone biosynthesis C-methylase UbiE